MFALADCNNFFCSCERVFNPALEGRPLVVLTNNDGCICARSNEAKALGLGMAVPVYQVRDILQANNVAVRSSNYQLYADMSGRVMSILARYAPKIDIYSIDEAFLNLSTISATPEELGEYARGMVTTVKQSTGIPISVGVAHTRTLAKVASRFAKKYPGYHGATVINTEQQRCKALSMTDVADVWGIGRRYSSKLARYGIKTALEFANLPPEWVKRNMTITGLRTWQELNGQPCIDVEPLPRKKSIVTSRSFPGMGLSRLAEVGEALSNFAARTAWKVWNEGSVATSIMVWAHTSRFRTDIPGDSISAVINLPTPTADVPTMVSWAMSVLRNNWKGDGRFFYKKGGFMAMGLEDASHGVQANLFDDTDHSRRARLMRAMEAINSQQGRDTVRMATQGYSSSWHITANHLSQHFTTDISQIIQV